MVEDSQLREDLEVLCVCVCVCVCEGQPQCTLIQLQVIRLQQTLITPYWQYQ